ncbi:MAG: class I SAM-dependent methyltransferase [Parachlamydiaceae bacterium]|nr:class I SAM-dependent methyltransferase [Parachlamydiaceae bacterium]
MGSNYLTVTYDLVRTPKTDYPALLVKFLSEKFGLQIGSTLLEVGCGRGDFLKAFANAGFDCFGVDREESAIELSEKLNIKTCDISKDSLPFEDNSLDIVFHKSLIEHLYVPDNLMRETFRVLKKGGKVVILTPDWVSQMRNFYEDITHCRPYDRRALRDALAIFGFENIITEKFYQLPVIWKHKWVTIFSKILQLFLNSHSARFITEKTRIKFFRWSVELMILGFGAKP